MNTVPNNVLTRLMISKISRAAFRAAATAPSCGATWASANTEDMKAQKTAKVVPAVSVPSFTNFVPYLTRR